MLQRTSELTTRKWCRILQIQPQALEMNNEDVDASILQFEKIALDVNVLSMHTLVQLQKLASQELVDRD